MIDNLSVTLFTAVHNNSPKISNKLFTPIHVGKLNSLIELKDTLTDDTGDNISDKNKNYCELTALYWIWKNYPLPDYIGLSHYRRFFNFYSKKDRRHLKKEEPLKKLNMLCDEKHISNIKKALSKKDIILPRLTYPKYNKKKQTIEENFLMGHIPEDWNIMLEVLEEKYPHYYEFSKKYFLQEGMHYFNMFISKKDFFTEYMEWIFDILFEVEKRIEISLYPYQQRIFGFLSERLFNLYIYFNKLKIEEVPVSKIDF